MHVPRPLCAEFSRLTIRRWACAVGYAQFRSGPFIVRGELGMSGRKFSFEVNRTVNAPAATLFRLESDGANWSSWAKPLVLQSSWARQGDPAPGGVGAVRKVGLWPFLVQEETVEYEQDHRHVYKLVAPSSPAKDYLAEVVLTPNAAGGTDLRWSGSFTEGVRGTGPVMRAVLGGAVRLFADRLVKTAEREQRG
jgi:uncharacterized protein YndB with AHSA1/START domain